MDIQQLTMGPITNDDSDNSKIISNPDSNEDEFFSNYFVIIVTSLCYRCVGRDQRERPTDRPSKR